MKAHPRIHKETIGFNTDTGPATSDNVLTVIPVRNPTRRLARRRRVSVRPCSVYGRSRSSCHAVSRLPCHQPCPASVASASPRGPRTQALAPLPRHAARCPTCCIVSPASAKTDSAPFYACGGDRQPRRHRRCTHAPAPLGDLHWKVRRRPASPSLTLCVDQRHQLRDSRVGARGGGRPRLLDRHDGWEGRTKSIPRGHKHRSSSEPWLHSPSTRGRSWPETSRRCPMATSSSSEAACTAWTVASPHHRQRQQQQQHPKRLRCRSTRLRRPRWLRNRHTPRVLPLPIPPWALLRREARPSRHHQCRRMRMCLRSLRLPWLPLPRTCPWRHRGPW